MLQQGCNLAPKNAKQSESKSNLKLKPIGHRNANQGSINLQADFVLSIRASNDPLTSGRQKQSDCHCDCDCEWASGVLD